MSALEACRLFVGAEFFMRWDQKDEQAPLQAVKIHRVELFADLNPRRLLLHVFRKTTEEGEKNDVRLTVYQTDPARTPTLSFTDSGATVSWALPAETQQAPSFLSSTLLDNGTKFEKQNFSASYYRPIRSMSSDVFSKLMEFPVVSRKDIESFGNLIHRDLRAETSCTLMEWESLVRHVTSSLHVNVRHEPAFVHENVPRYDEYDMTIHFQSLRSILRVFRHLTLQHVRQLAIKVRTRRKRRCSKEDGALPPEENKLVQVVGECVSKEDEFAFTVGSAFQPGMDVDPCYRYPVLYRPCSEWNNRDRMFEHDLIFEWKTQQELQSIRDRESTILPVRSQAMQGGKKRVRESYLGFKWIRKVQKRVRSSIDPSLNAEDIHGTLHFCAPSTVFVGSLFVPDVLRLCSEDRGLFNST